MADADKTASPDGEAVAVKQPTSPLTRPYDTDFSAIASAYQDAMFGVNSFRPPCAVMSGRLILEFRPDLEATIDPGKVYFVTKSLIVEVEE